MAERKLSPERRARILEAARRLILLHGLRATTMEAVAREAQIAKPTLYGYFPDKEAVFAALVQTLAGDLRDAVDAALSGQDTVVARVSEALSSKYGVIARLLEGSPHAEELYSEHDRGGANAFAEIDALIQSMIAAELGKAGVAEPKALTELLLGAAYGLARKTKSHADLPPAIALLTRRLVEPELPARKARA